MNQGKTLSQKPMHDPLQLRRAFRSLAAIALSALLLVPLRASDLVEVIPLTPRVIALHFDDGHVQYRGYHSSSGDDRVFSVPLDTVRATHPYAFLVFSEGDSRYQKGIQPLQTGRKSKPNAFSDSCIWTGQICDNEHVLEHWIYLELPHALNRDETYTIWVGNLAENLDEVTFTFNEFEMRSELVHVNQLGYRPSATYKYGYLAHWAGDFGGLDLDFLEGSSFYLVDQGDGTVAYQGTIGPKRRGLEEDAYDFGSPDTWGTTNNFYGSDVWEVDFSSFSQTGEYRLVVEGVGCSYPFVIADNVYKDAYYHTTRGLFYQRAGIAKEEPEAGKWAQPRDHHPDDGLTTLFYTTWPSVRGGEGSSAKDSILANVVGEISDWGWGWYHDAGDWDGYVHHTDVPYALLACYEMAPQNFRDHQLNIPESGNGIPDILDEAGWLIQYFRRNLQPDGGVAGGRVHSDFNDKPEASPSYEDDRPWYVCGPDPQTGYLFAGLAAQYAYCLEMAGISDSTAALLAEAEMAYQWAGRHHHIAPGIKVKGATVTDLRMYAASNLFKLTGQSAYQDDFAELNRVTTAVSSLSGGDYNQRWAVWSYVTSPDHPDINAELKDLLSQAVINHARSDFLEPARKRSARVGYGFNMPAVVGSTTTPVTLAPMIAQHVATGAEKEELIDYIHTTADYFLGNNPLNMSWITGLGDRTPQRLLHLDSRYDREGIDPCVPGLVPYGPLRHGDHFLGEDAQGPWDADFAKIRSYPDRYSWPVSEFWFDNPYSVLDGEFTVHQTNAPAAATYGFLAGDTLEGYAPNREPGLNITTPLSDLAIDEKDTLEVGVNAWDDRRVDRVEFYLDHHPLTIARATPFGISIPGKDVRTGSYRLTAVAVDNEGLRTSVEGPLVTIAHLYEPVLSISPSTDTVQQGESMDVSVDLTLIADAEATEVVLFLNGMELGRDNAAPFEFRIDSIRPLFNEIKAVVAFKEGFRSESKIERYAKPEVAGISFKKKEIEVYAGEYVYLEYTIFPEEAENRAVSFQSLNDTVAVIDEGGRIRALTEGRTRAVVTTLEGGFTDTAAIAVLAARPSGPFNGKPLLLPAIIEAEEFDFGGEGFAYHDLTPGNSEASFRQEDVDVGQTYDDGSAYHVTQVQPGEWLNYTIFVPETNLYDIRFRYTAGAGNPTITLKSDGQLLEVVTLPEVGWYPFRDHLVEGIYLEEGEQVLTLVFDNGLLTLNNLELTCQACTHVLPQEIRLNYRDLNVAVGGTVQLRASMVPSDVTNQLLYWKSLQDSIAYVDQTGLLTALDTGATRIVVVSDVLGLTDTCEVRVLTSGGYSPGLTFEYFEGVWDEVPDFAGMTPLSAGTIPNFDISSAPAEDYFGFRFFGEIHIHVPGDYLFFTASDDGSMLYIDGREVVDNGGTHATIEQGGTIELDSGLHQVEVLFFEKAGGATLEVSYQGPGIEKGPVPDTILGRHISGGELVGLQGISMPDTLMVPLESSFLIPVLYLPADASDRKINFEPEDAEVAQMNDFGYVTGIAEGTTQVVGTSRDGNHADSVWIRVTNDRPEVTILTPGPGSSFTDTSLIPVTFEARDTVGGIVEFRLEVDDQVVQTAASGTGLFLLGPLSEGSYRLLITATDRHGAQGHSGGVTIYVESHVTSVRSENLVHPKVTAMPNPFDGEIYFRIELIHPASVTIRVFDQNGALSHVGDPVRCFSGVNELKWDGTTIDGKMLQAGIYIVTLLVREEAGHYSIPIRLIRE